jgi:uncharacterized membrane protein YtjA (UPF0391 family)
MLSGLFLGWAVAFWIAAMLCYLLDFSGAASTTFFIANVLGVISLSLAALFVFLRLSTKSWGVSRQDSLPQPRFVRLVGFLRRWLETVGLL